MSQPPWGPDDQSPPEGQGNPPSGPPPEGPPAEGPPPSTAGETQTFNLPPGGFGASQWLGDQGGPPAGPGGPPAGGAAPPPGGGFGGPPGGAAPPPGGGFGGPPGGAAPPPGGGFGGPSGPQGFGNPPGGFGTPPGGAFPGGPAEPEKKRGRTGLVLGLVGLLAVGGIGTVLAMRFLSGSSDNLASRTPADAQIYAHVNLNPSAENKLGLMSLVDRINEAADEDLIDIDELLDEIGDDSDVSFADDIDPWLGDQIAVFAAELDFEVDMDGGSSGQDADFAVLFALEDRALAEEFVRDQIEQSGSLEECDTPGDQLCLLDEDDEEARFVFDGDVLLVGTEDAVNDSLAIEDGQSLAEEEDFSSVMGQLPDGIVTLYADARDIVQEVIAGADDIPLSSLPDLPEGGVGVSVSVTDGTIDITTVALVDGEPAESVAPSELADLPADALLYLRIPALGSTLETQLDALDDVAAAAGQEDLTAQVDEALEEGLDTSISEIAEWLGDTSIVLGYDPSDDEDNFLFQISAAVADEDAAADLVDGAVEMLQQSGGDVPGLETGSGSIALGDASWRVEDDAMVIQLGSEPSGTLGDDDAFQSATEDLPGDVTFYMDVRRIAVAVAPFAASGGGDLDEAEQIVNVVAAFDSISGAQQQVDGLSTTTLRISFREDLDRIDLGDQDEPNLPDVQLGPLGSLADLAGPAMGGVMGGGLGPGTLGPEPAAPAIPDPLPTPPAPELGGEAADAGCNVDITECAELASACTGGDLAACDQLWAVTAIDSPLETLAETCGGQTTESLGGRCEAELGGGGDVGAAAPAGCTADASTCDQLIASCGGGDYAACDQLWLVTEIGSDLETFAETCGGITTERYPNACQETFG